MPYSIRRRIRIIIRISISKRRRRISILVNEKRYFLHRENIITELYNSPDINEAIGKMQPVELQDELKQEVFLVLCEMDTDKLFMMYEQGYLKYFIVRTILNMAKSDRSNFYRKFRQVYQEIPVTYESPKEDYDESLVIKLEQGMEVLHWYEAELLKLYSHNKNLLAISRETKIPYRSLLKTIRKAKTLLKYKIRNNELD